MYILQIIKRVLMHIIRSSIYENNTRLLFYKSIYDECYDSNYKPETELKTAFITEHDNWQVLFPEKTSLIRNKVKEFFKKRHRCFALFDTDNNIIGAIWFGFKKEDYDLFTKKKKNIEIKESEFAYVYLIKIRPSMKGKGYGSYLISEFLDTLKAEEKIKFVTCRVHVENYSSIAVHLKFGYQLFGIRCYKMILMRNKTIESIFK